MEEIKLRELLIAMSVKWHYQKDYRFRYLMSLEFMINECDGYKCHITLKDIENCRNEFSDKLTFDEYGVTFRNKEPLTTEKFDNEEFIYSILDKFRLEGFTIASELKSGDFIYKVDTENPEKFERVTLSNVLCRTTYKEEYDGSTYEMKDWTLEFKDINGTDYNIRVSTNTSSDCSFEKHLILFFSREDLNVFLRSRQFEHYFRNLKSISYYKDRVIEAQYALKDAVKKVEQLKNSL